MTKPIYELISRILPESAHFFEVKLIASSPTQSIEKSTRDWFSIESLSDIQILIKGNTSISIISGFYWYLKHYCNLHLSWCGDQIALPQPLPRLELPIVKTTPHQKRVYFNYCTFNYSASWWDWARWEREIDFMALNGINMPLSIVGLEGTWYYALLEMGFTDKEARSFLCGPAFLAWQFMTNIQSHAGPLPKTWIDQRIELGQKILQRQRELGMTPIIQGFSGYVPKATQEKFPSAKIKQQASWCGFEGVFQLDPLDPLFEQFGTIFFRKQLELFGSDHLYAADPFHEGTPPQKGLIYLYRVGKAIHKLMKSIDKNGIWVMQAWSLRMAIVKAVPKTDLLILDLDSSKWKLNMKFWGYPFIGGKLHNFGGRINLHGDLGALSDNPFAIIKKKARNNLGMGLFMEGIIQNPIYYDMAFDLIWRDTKIDLNDWIENYIHRRYGKRGTNSKEIANLFWKTAYCSGTDGVEKSSIVCARPALDVKKSGPNDGFHIPYDPHELEKMWKLILDHAPISSDSEGYRYDVVDIGRQCLSNYAQRQYRKVKTAWEQEDLSLFEKETNHFIEILLDIDRLISSRPEFTLDEWIETARAWGKTDEEKNFYEYNSKMLVSLWGPENLPLIFDYSWREWTGLIEGFYSVRWQKFFEFLKQKMKSKEKYNEKGLPQVHGRESWRAEWETQWVKSITNKAIHSELDEISLAQEMWKKYQLLF